MSTPQTRAYGTAKGTVLMQGRVSPDVRARVQEQAQALGISQAMYLEYALRYVLENDVLARGLHQQENRPVTG